MTHHVNPIFPRTNTDRDRWTVSLRPPRNEGLDPRRAYAWLREEEPDESGHIVPIATIFLTNRECPWKCVMCDLWRNTLTDTVAPGDIVEQIYHALAQLPPVQQVKLYNAGSFFDPRAIPPDDHAVIAERMRQYDRVIVECHPALLGKGTIDFREHLGETRLEVAIGLETVHPSALQQLNKRMTVDQFRRAADFLRVHSMALRVFLLICPPFIPVAEQEEWLRRSVDLAFDCGATAVSLIPTRGGNGAMEALRGAGQFIPPTLAEIEAAAGYGLGLRRGRVFIDLWDLGQFAGGEADFAVRLDRLATMNRIQ